MNCLVTGATGFIGRELCRSLVEQGYCIIPWSRSGDCLDDGTTTKAVDLKYSPVIPEQLQQVDIVFHLAGIAHQQAGTDSYQQINHRASLALARAAEKAGVKHFVFLSSVKAMGPAPNEHPRAEQECRPTTDPYGLSKWQAEQGLREAFAGSAMQVTIVRPALVYGAQAKGNLEMLYRGISRGLPRPPEGGGRSMISLPDLVALLCTLARGEGAGGTWIVADGAVHTTREIYDLMRTLQHLPPGKAWCPRWVWRLGAAALDVLRRSPESTWQKMFGTELYDNRAVLTATSWRPRYSLADILVAEERGS